MPGLMAMRALGFLATLLAWALLLALLLPSAHGLLPTADAFDAVASRLAVTLPLAAMAMILAVSIALAAALVELRSRATAARAILSWASRLLVALSPLWLGMLLVVVVAGALRWLPAGGFMPWERSTGGALVALLLPSLSIALPASAWLARLIRPQLVGLADRPEVVAARLSGMARRSAMWRVGLPRAFARLAPQAGMLVGAMLAGAMVVENVFYLPGLGRLFGASVAAGDGDTLRALLLAVVAIVASLQLAADGAALALDRRPETRQ